MRIVALLFLIFIVPSCAMAQSMSEGFLNTTLELVLQPTHPSPGDTVEITLNDYRGSNYGSDIEWFLNDKAITSARNQRSTTLTAGAAGTSNTVKVVLTSPTGSKDVLTTTIKPVHLDIIVEPQTRVPDFYLGRALPSVGSVVNLTALLNNGNMMDEANLVYTWRVQQEVLEGGPIRGGNQVSFVAPQGSELIIALQISRPDGSTVARRSLIIPSVNPQVHFYEVSTLYGTNPKAVSRGFSLIGNSATIKAEPYYLDSRVFNNPSISEWSINNDAVESYDQNPYEITLQRTGFSGAAQLGFHVRSTELLLQGGRSTMPITF